MSFTDNSENQTQTLYSLPDVYRSDINLNLSDVVLDRFFTKDNTKRVIGYVGIRTNTTPTNTQLQESTPHRQAFQLAPTMYTNVGTIELALSFKEFQNKLSMLGVDIDRMDRWANSTEFTWVPPVNLDMLINYQNYFWISDTNNNAPQYLTIENVCNKSKYLVDAYDNILKQRGTQYGVVSTSFANNSFSIRGNVVSQFSLDNIFYTKLDGNVNLDDKTWTIASLAYDQTSNTTTLSTSTIAHSNTTPPPNPIVGQWWYNTTTLVLSEWTSTTWITVQPIEYTSVTISAPACFPIASVDFLTNSFTFVGMMDDIFADGFVFVIRGAGTYLSENQWTAVSSDYNVITNTTKTNVLEQIAVVGTVPPTHTMGIYSIDPVVGYLWFNTTTSILRGWTGIDWQVISPVVSAIISITDLLTTYRVDSSVTCGMASEFGIGEWDDRAAVWDDALLIKITHNTIQGWLVHNKLEPLALWYNPTIDQLYQYGDINNSDPSSPTYLPIWNPTIANFSSLLPQSSSPYVFDMYSTNTQSYNQWSTTNKWIHKSSVNSFNGIKRAQLPILEYDSRVELNEWVRVEHTWKYRATVSDVFSVCNTIPNRLELEPIKGYTATQIGGSWYLFLFQYDPSVVVDSNYVNILAKDSLFRIVDKLGGSHLYVVDTSEYRRLTPTDPASLLGEDRMVTVVKIKDTVFNSPLVGGGSNYVEIVPAITSNGDAWVGYHQHWCLIENNTKITPTSPQKINVLAEFDNLSISSKIKIQPIKGVSSLSAFVPQISSISIGLQYQEFTVDIAGITTVDLLPEFTYNSARPGVYCIAGSGDIRVYVNRIHQYGSYTEIQKQSVIGYTRVDSTALGVQHISNVVIGHVIGVKFNDGFLQLGDVVKICIGSAAYDGMGLTCMPVRTVESDTLFATSVSNLTQPKYMSLTPYKLVEQQKVDTNQYPLFNVYDIITNDVVIASPVFSFKESLTAAVNNNINKRIIQLDNGTNYVFQQHLSDVDNGILFGYRNMHMIQIGTFWYNPISGIIQVWDGSAWSSVVTAAIDEDGIVMRAVEISINDPISLWTIIHSMWYNPTTNALYKRDVVANKWMPTTDPIVNLSDPTLQTIWQPTINQKKYVPKYVDASGAIVPVNSIGGDWEVINQWKYNPEHSNRIEISSIELYNHCNSIITNQKKKSGLTMGGVFSYAQSQYDFGVGGTIKDYGDSFDTLISTMNVSNVSPIGIIEYVEQEYTSAMQSLFKILMDNLSTILPNSTSSDIFDFNSYIASSVVAVYESNDVSAKLYGDSSTYDYTNHNGIKNWISSPPVLGLLESHQPMLSVDTDGTIHILHHDGHRSSISYTVANVDMFCRRLARILYPQSTKSMCKISSNQPPTTLSNYVTIYGNTLLSGLCWYVIGNTTSFYRLDVYKSSPTPPTLFGNIIPDGVKYYNTTENKTYVVTNGSWAVATTGIGALWTEINLAKLAGNIYLEVENRLYAIAKDVDLKFDYNNIVTDDRDIVVYEQKRRNRFDNYVAINNIVSPFTNYAFSLTDPWTWNYQHSLFNTYLPTTPTAINVVQTSSWQSLYSFWYTTPYPHLEPWKLQGYINKPTWWDNEYLDTTGTRMWKYNHNLGQGMWTNIMSGKVPLGYPYPNGVISSGNSLSDNQLVPVYKYLSVNIGDVTIQGGYVPDSLLPPYYDNSGLSGADQLVICSLISKYSNVITPGADCLFGSVGLTEWNWIISSGYQYDRMIIAFMMQPSKWLHASFGTTFTSVSTLDIGVVQKQVLSHDRTIFHGDVYNTNNIYHASGLNQWYVHYNRYMGFDSNNEFRQRWVGWKPKLTYQFGNIIDSGSLSISSTSVDVRPQDYKTILVNTGILSDVTLDAFNIKLIYIPPHSTAHSNEQLWKFDVSVLNNSPRLIEYYGVKSYTFVVNTTTNVIDIVNAVLPWTTGDMVIFNSSGVLPFPLVNNTPYFIIRDDTTGLSEFKIAETFNDAMLGASVDITTVGSGVMYVSEANNSFVAIGGSFSGDIWYHLAIDKTTKNVINLPSTVVGIQNLINIIDGMSEVYTERGFVFDSADSSNFDPTTGRLINWQLEVERFIEWAYGIQSFANQANDRYNCVVNTSDNVVTITDSGSNWVGIQQVIFTSTGVLPTPLYPNIPYYIFPKSVANAYQISISNSLSDVGSILDITTVGSGQLMISQYSQSNKFASFELNPHRNVVLLSTPTGILSDVVNGPSLDVNIGQTIFDQYGRSLNSSELFIYRNDSRCSINIMPQMTNDVDNYYTNDPYNYIHIGGCRLFTESYEHFVLFEDYTIGNKLIYDPFLGITTARLRLDFQSDANNVKRPTLGGYYLHNNQFKRNIEGAAYDLNTCYDVFSSLEDSDMIKRSRDLLGYSGDLSFLTSININPKSQFMFYRGMIATKGSTAAISAYTNSKKFTQSSVDEFWAYKVSSFGDARHKVYPEIKILPTDNIIDDIRLEFVGVTDSIHSSEVTSADKQGFINILTTDTTRWNNYPDQREIITTSLFLDAELTQITSIFINEYPPSGDMSSILTYWYNSVDLTLHAWSGIDWSTIVYNKVKTTEDYVYVKNDTTCDDVRVVRNEMQKKLLQLDIIGLGIGVNSIIVSGQLANLLYVGVIVDIADISKNKRTCTIIQVDYILTSNTTIIQLDSLASVGIVGGQLYAHVYDFSSFNTIFLSPQPTGQSAYYIVNNECVRFTTSSFSSLIYMYNVNPSKNRISPAKLIDTKSNTVVENIPLWHPAIGYHYYVAEHNIDLQSQADPARYSNTPSTTNISNNAWNLHEANKVWMDTSYLGYIPYSDVIINPLVGDRLAKWGKLADFGSVRVYNWTVSPVLPSGWGELVKNQSTNKAISQNDKATGVANPRLFTTTRTILSGVVNLVTSNLTITNGTVNQNDSIIFSVLGNIPIGIEAATKYIVSTTGTNLTTFALTDLVGNPVTFSENQAFVSVIPMVIGNIPSTSTDYADVLEHVLQVRVGVIANGDVITFSTTGTLPSGLLTGVEYTVIGIIPDDTNTTVVFKVVALASTIVIGPKTLDQVATTNLGSNVYYYPIGKGDLYLTKVKQPVLLAPSFDRNALTNRPFVRIHSPIPLLVYQIPIIIHDPDEYCDLVYCDNSFIATLKTTLDLVTSVQFPITNPKLTWNVTTNGVTWYTGENIDIYVNGKFAFSSVVVVNNSDCIVQCSFTFNETDIVDVVRSFSGVDLSFDPTTSDDGSMTTWWVEDYEYTTTIITTPTGIDVTSYCFWVEGSTNTLPGDNKLSVASIASNMLNNPAAYFIVQHPLDSVIVDSSKYGWNNPPFDDIPVPIQYDQNGEVIVVPPPIRNKFGYSCGTNIVNNYSEMFVISYREAIIRNVSQYVSGSDRYVIRFTRDLTLRDDIQANSQHMNLKNIHDEWILFRKGQNSNLPIYLWNKLTESLAGITLDTKTIIPSADRVLYDSIHGTDTQYGLGVDQVFVNQQLGLATVLHYLTDPLSDFSPINIEDFMNTHNFNTPANIILTMDAIYNTFGYTNVNGLWFAVLYDALSTKSEYKDLMKTSWISLNGLQVLDVNGIISQQ